MDFLPDTLVFVVLSLKNTRFMIGQFKVSEEAKAERETKNIKNPECAGKTILLDEYGGLKLWTRQ